MSPWGWLDGYAHMFNVHGSSKSGQLWYANVDYSTAGVVRQKFLFNKVFS